MIYFYQNSPFEREQQLEAWTFQALKHKMFVEFGHKINDMSKQELFDFIIDEYQNTDWNFVADGEKDTIEVLDIAFGMPKEKIDFLLKNKVVFK